MFRLELKAQAIEDCQFWAANDRKLLARCFRMFEEIRRAPFEGIGKPEPLRGDKGGLWSRRISDEHRMIYEVTEGFVIVHALRGHYED
jgi:toxin YoeB